MNTRTWFLCTVAACLGLPPVAGGRDLSVTVYNHDLGVVRDARTVALEAGVGSIRFTDVAAQIDPTSVHLHGALRVLEQNYSFDLASADKILNRYLDRTIDIMAAEGRAYRGTLLAYDGGSIVVRDDGGTGAITIVGRDDIQDMRFPELPDGLITKPTLIWTIDAPRAGDAEVELSYMTGGMSWHAEYVAVIAPDERSMELSGWVSVENRSGATFPDAGLKLVAGQVHRAEQPKAFLRAGRAVTMDAMPEASFEERGLFEYHIYDLQRRTTIADQEIKQIALFGAARTPIDKHFELDAARYGDKVQVLIEAKNEAKAGLGMPLPAGVVRAMKADTDQQLEFIGEDRIDHTPRNESIKVRLGAAFDVVAERIIKSTRRLSDRVSEQDVEIKLRNRKTEAIEVRVLERPGGSWEILTSSHAYTKKEANLVEFVVPVAADAETVVTYTTRLR